MRIQAKLFVEDKAQESLRFKDDDNKDVEIDRTLCYILFAGSSFPDKLYINQILETGEYTVEISLSTKAEKLRALVDFDSIKKVK